MIFKKKAGRLCYALSTFQARRAFISGCLTEKFSWDYYKYISQTLSLKDKCFFPIIYLSHFSLSVYFEICETIRKFISFFNGFGDMFVGSYYVIDAGYCK